MRNLFSVLVGFLILEPKVTSATVVPDSYVIEGRLHVCKDTWYEEEKYYRSCSVWGWGRCTSYRSVKKYNLYCCSGYSPYWNDLYSCSNAICDGKINPTGACNINYSKDFQLYRAGPRMERKSGGSCSSPNQCSSCNDGFYGDGPYCRICPPLANCHHRRCSSPSDNHCEYCHGEVSQKQYYRAYTTQVDNTTCQKACSWRSDSTRCFPGVCSQELASKCTCTTGFTGTHCETMTEYPSILYNEAKLRDAVNNVKVAPPDVNAGPPQDTVWTNNRVWTEIDGELNAEYKLSVTAPSFGGDHFVQYFDYGIKQAYMRFELTRGGANSGRQMYTNCPQAGLSERTPKKTLNCDVSFKTTDYWSTPFMHNDQIKLTYSVTNGGYGKYLNRENSGEYSWSLNGKTTTHSYIYHFDMVPPYHCVTSVTSPCGDFLTVTDLTESSQISISWDGWTDDLSQLSHYQYELFLLGHDTVYLGEHEGVGGMVISPTTVNGNTASFQIPSGVQGMYAVHLSAFDNAGNYWTARRVFLFDDISSVEIINQPDRVTRVVTASQDTDYLWVVQDTNSVKVQWTDRFRNARHEVGRWLNEIKTPDFLTDSRYDDHSGNRTIAAINNVHAVVDFKVKFEVYDDTGVKDSRPLTSVSDIQNQYDILTVNWADGDKLTATVRPIDILGKYIEESVTVYRDASPPVIEDLWLTRGDRLNISVHRIEDFREMTIEWLAYDYHSGIDSIYWRLFDNYTGQDILHGKEDILAQGNAPDLATCQTTYGTFPRGANCYCTAFWGCYHQHFQVKPEIKTVQNVSSGLLVGMDHGVHDSDYYLEVSVTSKAMLTTVLHKKITIDSSPPHTGVVHDGIRGVPEVDYQQSLTLNAHWDGFFDRESGVLFYQYGFDTQCITKDKFKLELAGSTLIHETYSLHATHTVTTEGKYYITVVAFNRALEPSDPVCSDGVTVDTTVPSVKEVVVEGARIKGGLITDSSSSAYYVVGNDRVRRLIPNPTSDCISKATPIADIDMLPQEKFPNGTLIEVDGGVFCTNTSSAPTSLDPMLSKSSTLYIEWTPVDTPGGIYDYEVGLASIAGSASPDILSFRSTKQHAHIQILHEDVTDGTLFYIILKSTSKSDVTGLQTIGPCFMDTTPPDFSGSITLSYSNGYIYASWAAGTFLDNQDSYPLNLEFAIGHEPGGTDIHYYSPPQAVGPCTLSTPPTCTAIKVDDTDGRLHGHYTYYVTIKAENSAGLVTYGTSSAYVHDVQLPALGVVNDILEGATSATLLMDVEDIDFQTSKTSLSASWRGFDHPHLDVTYKFKAGTTPGAMDIVSDKDLGSAMYHTETGLTLSTLQTYYITITAASDAGSVSVTADGVTVVEENYGLSGIVINDGIPCNLTADTNFTHHDEDNRKPCETDIDFQSSTNELSAYWSIPNNMKYYTRDIHFAIEEKLPFASLWNSYRDYEHISSHYIAKVTDLNLSPGKTYRFKIKICAISTCYAPLVSDGVTILANSPVTGPVTIEHQNVTQGAGTEKIIVNMQRFYDPDIQEPLEKYSVIEKYEWTISDQSETGRTHLKWSKVTGIQLTQGDTWMTFTIDLPGEFDFSKCRRFAVRGNNMAKLVSSVSAEVKDCKAFNPILVQPNDVIDAVGELSATDGIGQPVFLDQNALWHVADRDYTPYHNYISAVWPRLRYHTYKVAVIHYKSLDITTYYKPVTTLDLPDPCSHPDAISCATTGLEFHNFKFTPGQLQHGQRYVVCLHADRTEIEHEKWLQVLPDLNTCTDGVIVDLTPPTAGDVWITNIPGTEYQSSTSDIYVNWHSFRDVEEMNVLPHSSGIQEYQLGIGTSPGGNDMVAFYSVGVVNHVALHNLHLQSGHIYYATVIGKDYANRTTTKTSSPVVVDTTPPVKSDVPIKISGRHIVSKTEIEACWKGVFTDSESSIDYYKWSVGSEPGYDDVMTFTTTTEECAENSKTNPLDLRDGHAYFISVKRKGNCNLLRGLCPLVSSITKSGECNRTFATHLTKPMMSLASSWAYVVDTTPPIAGHVYDGKSSNPADRKDIDFQTDMASLHIYWEGFHDPHSAIKEYYISIGTCPKCEDVISRQAIGIVNEIAVDHVHFGSGLTYYTTITACNTADLCTYMTSDGVIMDDSPPSMGLVFDGTMSYDLEYQSIRTYIGAKWYGFADPQSGLSRYEWRAGTTPGGDNIVAATKTHLALVTAKMNLSPPLPIGSRIYITVRAYNKAGLYTDATSDGFIVDITGPTISSGPSFVNDFGIHNNALFFRTSMKVQWVVADDESYIERQYLSLKSHIGGEFDLASTSVNGIARDFVLTGLSLHDGVTYYVQLISCNGAQICSTSESTGILVDTTPPTRGMFAINTDHAAELQRHVDGWMTWSSYAVYLAWLGFADLHSDIDYYEVHIGSSYFGDDLNKEPGVSQRVYHTTTGADKYDEGKVQTYTVQTVKLDPSIKHLYITVWAVNKAGLSSSLIHSQFEKVPGGTLSLVRRCVAITCEGHCVCSPQDKLCHNSGAACNDISSNNHNNLLSVSDRGAGSSEVDYVATNTALQGAWSIVHRQGSAPLWYQWSVGYASEAGPEGIFDQASERVWHDTAQNTFQIYTTMPGTLLTETEKYSFFLRVWYDGNTYAVFKSDGTTIATKPPSPTNVRGSSVNERMFGSNMKDQDHIKYGFPFKVDWQNKFLDAAYSIARFRVYVSTFPGGHDTLDGLTDIPGGLYTFDIKRSDIKPGVKYYSNVIGYGLSGIHHTESSDGFRADKVKPVAGMVYDGKGLHDLEYQNSSTLVSARWHGFTDTGAGIVTYQWCVGYTTDASECGVRAWERVGLHVSVSRTLSTPLQQSTQIFNKVYAEDSVSYRSAVAVSDGVTIDITPPESMYLFHEGSNMLQNPSFESSASEIMIDDVNSTNICNLSSVYHPSDWILLDQSCAAVVASDKNLARDGRAFAFIRGGFMQRISNLVIGKLYRLNLFSSHILISSSVMSNKEGYVKLGDNLHVFLLYTKGYRQDGHGSSGRETVSWHRHTFYFEATDTVLNLTLGSIDETTGILLDHATFEVVERQSDQNKGQQVAAHVVSLHEWGSIHSSWGFLEDVSHIAEYTWAIGYTKGGTQIQGFESVGKSNFAYNSSVVLVHNSYIYVTVIASNTAGLQGVAYSTPILVDLTAPVFKGVYDGRLIGEDQDAWTDNEVSVNWDVEDLESGIEYCEWAIGYQPDSIELQSFKPIPAGTKTMFTDISHSLLAQRTIFTTIRCHNKAGLITSASSDGVKISNEAPSITNAVLKPILQSITEYAARDNYQSNMTCIRMTWTGFYDHIGLDQYQISIDGCDIRLMEKMLFPSGQDVMYANIMNLQTVPDRKTMSVRAINTLLIASDVVDANLTIFVEKPSKIANKQLQIQWNKVDKEFTVTWDGVFSSPHPLYYEVSAGKVRGGGEIVQWLETNSTSVTFVLPPAITDWSNLDVYMFVRAIAAGGLYEDIHGYLKLPK